MNNKQEYYYNQQYIQQFAQYQRIEAQQQKQLKFEFPLGASKSETNLLLEPQIYQKEISFVSQLQSQLNQIKCSQQNQFIMICCSQSCNHKAPICGQKKCKCKSQHKQCLSYFQTENFLDMFSRKTKRKNKFVSQIIEKTFQYMIDLISKFRDQLIQSAQKIYFTQNDLNLIEKIKSLELNQITGKQLFSCSINNKIDDQMKRQLDNEGKLKLQLKSLEDFVNKKINDCSLQFIKQNIFTKKILLQIKSSKSALNYYDSQILTSQNEVFMLQRFMPKYFKELNLIYRASQNNFKTKQFWETCVDIPNTLVLVLTQHHKVIGGYTPIPWKKFQTKTQQKDPSKQSFIFSLTQGDKFQLTDQNYATYYYSQFYGPQFGMESNADLCISDLSNSNLGSFSLKRLIYNNNKYNVRKEESNEKFTGSKRSIFKIIEWQVYSIIF